MQKKTFKQRYLELARMKAELDKEFTASGDEKFKVNLQESDLLDTIDVRFYWLPSKYQC